MADEYYTSVELMRLAVEECQHQQATDPLDYAGMMSAIKMAQAQHTNLKGEFAESLWYLWIRDVSHGEIHWPRKVPVTFANGTTVPFENIPRQLFMLAEGIREGRITPQEAYQEFEEIHPFADGNGRVGLIMYMYLTNFRSGVPMPEFKVRGGVSA